MGGGHFNLNPDTNPEELKDMDEMKDIALRQTPLLYWHILKDLHKQGHPDPLGAVRLIQEGSKKGYTVRGLMPSKSGLAGFSDITRSTYPFSDIPDEQNYYLCQSYRAALRSKDAGERSLLYGSVTGAGDPHMDPLLEFGNRFVLKDGLVSGEEHPNFKHTKRISEFIRKQVPEGQYAVVEIIKPSMAWQPDVADERSKAYLARLNGGKEVDLPNPDGISVLCLNQGKNPYYAVVLPSRTRK